MVSSSSALTRTSWTEIERLLQEAARGFGCPRGYAKEFARVAAWSECVFPGFLRHHIPRRELFSDPSVPPLHELEIEDERILVVVNQWPAFWLRFGPGLVDVAIARRATVPKIRVIVFGDTDIGALWYSLSRLHAEGYGTTALIEGYTNGFVIGSRVPSGNEPQPFVLNEADAVVRSQAISEERAITARVKHRCSRDESSRVISISINGSNGSRGSNIWIENGNDNGREPAISYKFDETVVDRKLAESSNVGFSIEVSDFHAVREAAHAFLVNDGDGSRNNAG